MRSDTYRLSYTPPEEVWYEKDSSWSYSSVGSCPAAGVPIHSGPNPFVTGDMGERLHGLETLAEDGDPAKAAETLGMMDMVVAHGVAPTPVGQADPGLAFPGAAYSFTVNAHDGERLSFATMYVQSNDLFYSPSGDGLPLFAMGAPVSGDVTDRIVLYDAGTEVNEEPGMGPNLAPWQPPT